MQKRYYYFLSAKLKQSFQLQILAFNRD